MGYLIGGMPQPWGFLKHLFSDNLEMELGWEIKFSQIKWEFLTKWGE